MKSSTINIKDLDKVLKIAELQRDLVVRMHIYKEQQELQLKRLQNIRDVAEQLSSYKNQVNKDNYKELKTLTEEEIKEIKKLLKDRYLIIWHTQKQT